MYPKLYSGDCTLFEPVLNPLTLKKGDIVFAEVQPGNSFYAHQIQSIEYWTENEKWPCPAWTQGAVQCFNISNAKGDLDGWCFSRHIYGRLIEVIM